MSLSNCKMHLVHRWIFYKIFDHRKKINGSTTFGQRMWKMQLSIFLDILPILCKEVEIIHLLMLPCLPFMPKYHNNCRKVLNLLKKIKITWFATFAQIQSLTLGIYENSFDSCNTKHTICINKYKNIVDEHYEHELETDNSWHRTCYSSSLLLFIQLTWQSRVRLLTKYQK